MPKTEDVRIKIKADGSQAVKGLKQVRASLNNLTPSFSSMRNAALLATGAVAGVGAALFSITKNTAEAYDEIRKMSDRLGVGTEFLSKMEYAAGIAGMKVEVMRKSVEKMTVAIGEADRGLKTYKDGFDELGVSLRTTDDKLKTSEQIYLELAQAFNKMDDSTKKVNIAYKIFGQRGLSMLNMMNGGKEAIQETWQQAEKFGVVLSEDAADAAAAFNDSLHNLTTSLKGVRNAIGEELMDRFTGAFDNLANYIAANRTDIINLTKIWVTSLGAMAETTALSFGEISDYLADIGALYRGVASPMMKLERLTAKISLKFMDEDSEAAEYMREGIHSINEELAVMAKKQVEYAGRTSGYEKVQQAIAKTKEMLNELTSTKTNPEIDPDDAQAKKELSFIRIEMDQLDKKVSRPKVIVETFGSGSATMSFSKYMDYAKEKIAELGGVTEQTIDMTPFSSYANALKESLQGVGSQVSQFTGDRINDRVAAHAPPANQNMSPIGFPIQGWYNVPTINQHSFSRYTPSAGDTFNIQVNALGERSVVNALESSLARRLKYKRGTFQNRWDPRINNHFAAMTTYT